jgi:hypothetical protein
VAELRLPVTTGSRLRRPPSQVFRPILDIIAFGRMAAGAACAASRVASAVKGERGIQLSCDCSLVTALTIDAAFWLLQLP